MLSPTVYRYYSLTSQKKRHKHYTSSLQLTANAAVGL